MKTINVMAPLVIGDPADPYNESANQAWLQFDNDLAAAKKAGVYAVSTDVWWGLVEKLERQYDWRYYKKLSDHIIAAGLKWVPILSLHKCGGNIGDDVNVYLPDYVWAKVAAKAGRTIRDIRYVSQQGNESDEFVACWATDFVLEDYIAFFVAFRDEFADKAAHIAEINVSLGPAGELRFPSYNSHDKNTGYPTPGALQCYSGLAREDFVAWVKAAYNDDAGIRAAWGEFVNIEPPVDVEQFFRNRDHITKQYGRDFFDWYSDSLLKHGKKVLQAAMDVFWAEGSPLLGVEIGAKVPGVHWRMGHWDGDRMVIGDRLAELTAGLIRTSGGDWHSDENGRGYRPIVKLFKDVQQHSTGGRIVMHFTCLEMPDGNDESLAFELVRWVGLEARRQGVPLKGENAIAGSLQLRESWTRMRMALGVPGDSGLYEGLTLLRVSDAVRTDLARGELEKTITLSNGSVVALQPVEQKAA